jgi:hypothetical protein
VYTVSTTLAIFTTAETQTFQLLTRRLYHTYQFLAPTDSSRIQLDLSHDAFQHLSDEGHTECQQKSVVEFEDVDVYADLDEDEERRSRRMGEAGGGRAGEGRGEDEEDE